MIEFITGAALGIAGMFAKDKLLSDENQVKVSKQELKSLYSENEKLAKRKKELERIVEDLESDLEKEKRKGKSLDYEQDDLQEELEDTQTEIKRLKKANELLKEELEEYKRTYGNENK